MNSNWTLPTSVTQYAEADAENYHVSWIDAGEFHALKNKDGKFIKTSRDLLHIAKQPKHDLVEKTYFLKVTGFRFNTLPETLSGIEMKLTMNRNGRISDDTIQLFLENDVIGDNQASLSLNPTTIYGGEESKWGSNLSISNIQNTNFGVLVRFKSHPQWPHKCSALIDAIELRIH